MFYVGKRKQFTLIDIQENTSFVACQAEIARRLTLDPRTVHKWALKGKIKHYKHFIVVFHTDFHLEAKMALRKRKKGTYNEYIKNKRISAYKQSVSF